MNDFGFGQGFGYQGQDDQQRDDHDPERSGVPDGHRPREIWSSDEARRTAAAGVGCLAAAIPAGVVFDGVLTVILLVAGVVTLIVAAGIAVVGGRRDEQVATTRSQGQRGQATILDIKIHRPGRGTPTVTARLKVRVPGWQPYETTIRQTVPRFGKVAVPSAGTTITVFVDPAHPNDLVPLWP